MNTAPITDVHEHRSDATTRLFTLLAQAGPSERRDIEEQIIHRNMKMAVDATRRFRGRGIPDDDLQQVAYVGLVKAVRGFDAERGHDFLSYAVPTIRGEVRRHFRDLGWTVRPPRPVQEAQTKIIGCQGDLLQQLGRAPRPSEIAAHLGLDLELVVEALGANGCFAPASLDAHDDGEQPIGARLEYTDTGFDRAEARAVLAPLLARLSPRERTIVEMRFFRGCTQAQIGEEIGVTQMQVSRLLARLMARMRDEISLEAA
ncbi:MULTISPECIES: sigma-70 family RNA polymerase sigma factor [unclassified Nocardioides]|uniref:sigma-70 family RNA polymerase sigma factor n=1 Tax=unclassified Nocardioides TaxID=2615069 RepID=UPI0009F009B1|nr:MULTISPECIES: sigma-70 family RNA polymerase sigma factor [unclassified Nocardioides]GAW49067.1 sigma-70 region 2 domain-containing protein [Nocardioides sp. PD653-B2]GAW53223.1 sigma-70 region 2 domain-containing protein [Nocardioides sp. PD653]